MPFRDLNSTDVARAFSTLEAVWEEAKVVIPSREQDRERLNLACIIAEFTPMALDEDDLRRIVLLHYRNRWQPAPNEREFPCSAGI